MIPLLLMLPLPSLAPAADIAWEADYESAWSRASDEERVLFVAVLSDGESRSEAFWKSYKDKALRARAEQTVNLLSCLDVGNKKCDCVKDGDLEVDDARRMEAAIREQLITPNDEGTIASPQHLWFAPGGDLLLCAPYELSTDELMWCFAEADRLAGGEAVYPEDSRPPRRLLYGSSYTVPQGDEYGRGLRRDELKDTLDELKSSMAGGGGGGRRGGGGGGRGGDWGARLRSMILLAFTDEEDAQDYVALELGSGFLTWRGNDMLVSSIQGLGNLLPVTAHETLEPFADHRDADVRGAFCVAAEQLGSPELLKAIKSGYKREKDPVVKKNMLRAMGACAYGDKGVRKTLISESEEEEDARLRRNAIFALGWYAGDEEAYERLKHVLTQGKGDDVRAAAAAMALTRDQALLEVLRAQSAVEGQDQDVTDSIQAAIRVIEGADLRGVQMTVREVCDDRASRDRIFFHQVEPPELNR